MPSIQTEVFMTRKSRFAFAILLIFLGGSGCENTHEAGREIKSDTTQNRAMKDSIATAPKPLGVTNAAQERLSNLSYAMLSANFVDRVIHNESVARHLAIFKSIDPDKLDDQLKTDALRRCFWINIYNGYTQHFLKSDPSLYQSDRNEFFKKDQIEIAGFTLNMNDIEHGALRRGATIWSKGHIRIPFRNEFVNRFKVQTVDWHIHFALNCGAKSCPPVCVYLPDRADEQLDKAASYYLKKECTFSKKDNAVRVPALMSWFADDFGDKDSKRDILKKFAIIPGNSDPSIEYKDYDWEMYIENYKQF